MNLTLEYRHARAALADAEAALVEGHGGPYGTQNVESHRRRVERLKTHTLAPAPVVAAVVPPSTLMPAARPAPIPTGSREDRLKRLAQAMGADHRLLASAMASGASPDEFALQIVESRDPEAVAARIVASDQPAPPNTVDAEADAVVARILAA